MSDTWDPKADSMYALTYILKALPDTLHKIRSHSLVSQYDTSENMNPSRALCTSTTGNKTTTHRTHRTHSRAHGLTSHAYHPALATALQTPLQQKSQQPKRHPPKRQRPKRHQLKRRQLKRHQPKSQQLKRHPLKRHPPRLQHLLKQRLRRLRRLQLRYPCVSSAWLSPLGLRHWALWAWSLPRNLKQGVCEHRCTVVTEHSKRETPRHLSVGASCAFSGFRRATKRQGSPEDEPAATDHVSVSEVVLSA